MSWLAHEVLEKEIFGLDILLLEWIHQWANPLLDKIMLFITGLGDPEFVIVIVMISLSCLLWKRQHWVAIMFLATCLGAFILNVSMKLFFARARPLLWSPLIKETSYGFPSGHSLGSVVLSLLCYFPNIMNIRNQEKNASW